jgi:hypothetical protein
MVCECRYMKNVADVLEGIREQLPAFAAPVASALREEVERAYEKVVKYEGRGRIEAVWKASAESVRSSPWHTQGPLLHIPTDAVLAPVVVSSSTMQRGRCLRVGLPVLHSMYRRRTYALLSICVLQRADCCCVGVGEAQTDHGERATASAASHGVCVVEGEHTAGPGRASGAAVRVLRHR